VGNEEHNVLLLVHLIIFVGNNTCLDLSAVETKVAENVSFLIRKLLKLLYIIMHYYGDSVCNNAEKNSGFFP